MRNHAIASRKKLYERLESGSIVLLFSGEAPHMSLDQYYAYTPQRNFFYLTNLNEPHMILMLMKGKTQNKVALFIEENTDFIIKWEGARMEKSEVSERSGIDESDIHYLKSFEGFFNMAMNYARSPLGAPATNLYLDLYHPKFSKKPVALKQAETVLENYPELSVKNVNEHLSYLRMFKSKEEVEQLKNAVQYTRVGLERIMKNLDKRRFEYQLQADFLHQITFEGSEGVAFQTIAASGKNATVLHYVENRDTLKDGELILFDLGALHQNYAADISRTYPINGVFTERQKLLYSIVLKANKETINFVKPGITWKELNEFSRNILIKETKKIGLIENDAEIANYYYHTIGHFLGLDVHDVGYYDQKLEPGMVLTIEPGLYINEEKIGIRIEDDILVTEDGCINLSEDIPKEIDEIERFIKENK